MRILHIYRGVLLTDFQFILNFAMSDGGIVFRTSKIMPGMFRLGAPIMDVQPKSVISVLNIKGTCYIDGKMCIGKGG